MQCFTVAWCTNPVLCHEDMIQALSTMPCRHSVKDGHTIACLTGLSAGFVYCVCITFKLTRHAAQQEVL